jgi:hypothetical protein
MPQLELTGGGVIEGEPIHTFNDGSRMSKGKEGVTASMARRRQEAEEKVRIAKWW